MIKIDFDKLDRAFPNAYFEFASGCCEPGYDDNPVILADWNHVPNITFDKLESHGFSCEWSDEWMICDNCYKAFRSSPDCYFWQMYGVIFDGYAICGDCLGDEIEEYLESIENNPKVALTSSLYRKYNPIEYGYELVQDHFENGLHEGMNDNPEQILSKHLKFNPDDKFIFVMNEQSQFYVTFALYQKVQSE